MWQRVDVQIVPKVDPAAIGPVENADATDGILLNHAYVDMRGFSIAEAQEVVAEEAELLREIEAIGADDERLEELKDGLYEAASELSGFDVELLERSSRFPPLAPHQYRVAMADCLVMSRMHRRSHIFFFRSRGTSWARSSLRLRELMWGSSTTRDT